MDGGDGGSDRSGSAGDPQPADPARAPPVAETYDRIAAHFAETRAHPWPAVETFVADADPPRPAVGLDLGCANGRHAELLARRTDRVLGVDVSRDLLALARERARERGYAATLTAVQGDVRALPLADDRVGLAVYVATVHHLRSRADRVASLDELARVLAPGAGGLVSAWSVTHDRFDGSEGFDTVVDWTLPGGETVPRYYHIYDPAEFRADLESCDLVVEETFEERGNCYGVVRGP